MGTLIAGTSENSEAKLVGTGASFQVDSAGHLFLGINENVPSQCSIAILLRITQAHNGASAPATRDLKQQLSSAASLWLKGQFGSSTSRSTTSSNASAGNGNAEPASPSSTGLKVPEVILDRALRQDLDSLPRRAHDYAGSLGDSKEAGLKAIMSAYEKKDCLEMPMSHL